MAKPRKKHFKSDALHKKRVVKQEKKLNPFELHVNKEKFAVLNRKAKDNRGIPGASREKAFKFRQKTLGKEFQSRNKANHFKDRRDGDELVHQISRHKAKKSIYNLNDDEILTHKGRTLQDIERFDEAPAPSDDEEEAAKLDAEFTEAAHFGNDTEGGEKRDRKAVIDELIAQSKLRKAELIKENDAIHEMTQKLDENWRDLVPLVAGKLTRTEEEKKQPDEYDRMMREMIFERRGEPANPLKSDEEIARLEKEKLRKLEAERLKRMQDETERDQKPTHRSADDLDEGYFQHDVGPEPETVVAYDIKEQEEGSESDPEEEEQAESGSEEEAKSEEQSESGSEGEEEESEDNLDDLKGESSDEDPSEEEVAENGKETPLVDPKELEELHRVPSNYHAFAQILQDQTPQRQGAIVASMIENDARRNKEKSLALFAFLLQKVNDLFSTVSEDAITDSFRTLSRLMTSIYDLINLNPIETSKCLQEVLKEKQEAFKKRPKIYPSLETIIFLKLVSTIYSTSDFRHSIATPSTIFISQILTRSRILARRDLAKGLMLATIFLEFSQLSKRILPAVWAFLQGVIYLAAPKRPVELFKAIPPFQTGSNLLVLEKSAAEEIFTVAGLKMTGRDLVLSDIDDNFRLRCLASTLGLIQEYNKMLEENPGVHYLAEPLQKLLDRLDVEMLPQVVRETIQATKEVLQKCLERQMSYLVEKGRRPKPLRLLEPKIEKVYDGFRKHKVTSKVRAEREKLMHKIKRETKGAVREIRRDNEFLAKMKLKRQIQSDRVRNEKVKRIFTDAFSQQSELNAMKRKKKK